MRSQFFGNRLLDMRNADPFFTRAFMCPPPEISQEELDKYKALEGGAKASADEIAKLKADLEAAKKTPTPPPADPDDLAKKAALQREADEKRASDEKRLEGSINFLVGAKEWAKTNAALLPKTIDGILDAAEKENFGSKVEKANAIKVGIISEFFSIQSNVDALTAAQKVALEDFKKLTKDKKQEQAQIVYDQIFEPAFEGLKKIKRAEQIAKGYKDETPTEHGYRDRLVKGARKHFLGEKQ